MRYCAFFCEENVWHLCGDDAVASGGRPIPLEGRRAVFVSNAVRLVPMLHQRAGGGGLVQWDYHVVLLALGAAGWETWDLDCDLGAPLPLGRWLDDSFPDLADVPGGAALAPRFRVVEASELLATFSSDRSHMLDDVGRPQRPFPPWPPLQARAGEMNLMRFVDVTTPFVGEVLDLEHLRERFASR